MGDTYQQRSERADAREHLTDEVLSAYLDDSPTSLLPMARAYTDAHLAECAECRTALADLEATLSMLRALPQVELRRSFILTPEAAAAVGGPRLPRRSFGWVWPTRWATALAALIFVITIGLDLGDRASASSAPTVAPTVVAAAVSPTLDTPCKVDPALCGVTSFGLTPTIFPTPTTVQNVTAPQLGAVQAPVDWRPAQVASGFVALLGALCGFLLPSFLRRRGSLVA